MKKNALMLLLLATTLVQGQPRIQFSYDAAGNQVLREVCMNCAARTANNGVPIIEKSVIQTPTSQITYYPNPVLQELYVKWESEKENDVKEINLYSMTGQLMNSNSDLKGATNVTIAFQNYPAGFYNLILLYTNGETKTIRVVKK